MIYVEYVRAGKFPDGSPRIACTVRGAHPRLKDLAEQVVCRELERRNRAGDLGLAGTWSLSHFELPLSPPTLAAAGVSDEEIREFDKQ